MTPVPLQHHVYYWHVVAFCAVAKFNNDYYISLYLKLQTNIDIYGFDT